jgi:glyoxylase-like metal-dependent hydrolase (beta-lactamase superfamily II)
MPGVISVPLPPVERVQPGLWSVPVPIPINPLRYVLVYVFESTDGVFLVDAGWNTDEAFAALSDGLAELGGSMSDVRGVLVTHIHPDHYGLAGRIRSASGAWIGLHPADAALVRDRYFEPDNLLEKVGDALRRAGAPDDEIAALEQASMPVRPFVDAVDPDVLIEDGDRPRIPDWDVVAVWTPGHSPGHLCFYLGERRVMLTGDHVLPRITPNISVHPQSGPDPLGDFLRSLDRVAEFDVGQVLPAHEHRFVGLASRVEELKWHHERRFAEIAAAIEAGVDTAWGIATRMTWSRPWDRIDGFMRRAALGEAVAHLHAMRCRGLVRDVADGDGPVRWEMNLSGTDLD